MLHHIAYLNLGSVPFAVASQLQAVREPRSKISRSLHGKACNLTEHRVLTLRKELS